MGHVKLIRVYCTKTSKDARSKETDRSTEQKKGKQNSVVYPK